MINIKNLRYVFVLAALATLNVSTIESANAASTKTSDTVERNTLLGEVKSSPELSFCVLNDNDLANNIENSSLISKVRKNINFDASWRFLRDDNPKYRDVNYNDTDWRVLNVPHDWSVEEDYAPDSDSKGLGGFFNEGIAWYRKEFTLDGKDAKDKQYTIQFDGVFMNSEVWINGQFLGKRPYGYSTFQYDLTDYLKFGKGEKNVISVRVDNSNGEASRWYNGSGIYRHVHLIETNYTHFNNYDGVHITTPVAEADRAVVNVDYRIISNYLTKAQLDYARKNKYKRDSEKMNVVLRSIVFDSTGNEVKRTTEEKTISTYDKYVTFSQQVEVMNPRRWSHKSPNMYYLKSEIVYDNQVIDDVVTPFGIRKVDFNKDKGLLVNDKEVILKGVCLHHDAASLGAAVPEKVLVYRLSKLREIGCNAIRTSHNPYSPEFYAICDTMGFYVMDEAFDEWKDNWQYNYNENPRGKAKSGYYLYFDQWAETDLRDMVRRDRNHPSIVMYGIGNEIPFFRDNHAADIAKRLVSVCHSEDSTRPVSLGDNASEHTMINGVGEQMDILGYNYIMRQHPDSLYLPNRIQCPDKLFFGSETDKNIKYFLAARDNKYVIGHFIWTGIDYLGETRKAPQRGWQKSLLDVTLNPRKEGLMFDCCWSETPKVKITVASSKGHIDPLVYKNGITHTAVKNTEVAYDFDRTWNWAKNEQTIVNVYSNCEEVALKVNGKVIGKKKNDFSTYCTPFKVKYSAGNIEAIAYNNGKAVATDTIFTAGKVAKIQANAIHGSLVPNNTDVDIIEINLLDSKGHIVPTADNNVSVEVNGGAKFIGMDSGNLFYEGNFKTPNRNASRGKLVVYIQSNGKHQDSKVTLKSAGLADTTIVIKTKNK